MLLRLLGGLRCAAQFQCVSRMSLGLPGALPVLNRQVVEYAVLPLWAAALTRIHLSRKNYFYPYLFGCIEVDTCGGGRKKIGITRVHIEEDAGKSLHEVSRSEYSSIDLNRSGTPLIEIVSEPDICLARRGLRLPDEVERDHSLHRRQRLQYGRRLATLRRQRQHSAARPEGAWH